MDERTKEAVRYLGYGRQEVDEKTWNLIQDSFSELEEACEKRMTYRSFEMSIEENGCIVIGNMKIQSKNLRKNLNGCEHVILLGATLGIKVDLLMKRYSYTDMAKVVVLQACAAAMLEEYLDERQTELAEEMRKEGLYLRPRFSPGYGDFSILHQKDILTMTDAPKKIGLSMTDSSMLTPVKSVTALIGLSRKQENCHIKGCEACEKKDCEYRRS